MNLRYLMMLAAIMLIGQTVQGQELLVNGDFEMAPILGSGQSALSQGQQKWTSIDPDVNPNYEGSISGIPGWNYAIPDAGGTHTDVGLSKRNDQLTADIFNIQSNYSNRWNRLIFQTTNTLASAGTRFDASIDIGTIINSGARAGTFYLVAGGVDATSSDQFASDAFILDSVVAANPGWSGPSDISFDNFAYETLNLSYDILANDPAIGLPITVGFRIQTGSTGSVLWDNASLTTTAIPEPSGASLLLIALVLYSQARKRTIVI